jgi:hypothetical protein
MDVQFRIAQITDDARGVLTGAFVFSPPPHLPDAPRVLVERFGGENTKLGPHGWAVDSKGLRPRVVEKRGMELWLCFGAEVSFHVLPNTPVRISIPSTELEGTEIWPPIPRGKAPPADIPDDDAPWPEPPRAEAPPPAPPPPPPPPPPKVEEPTVIVAAPPKVEPPPPPPPSPPPPPPVEKRGSPLPLIAAVALLLLIGGGAAWWFLRPPPEQQQQQQAAAPTPAPTPPPASPDCAEAGDVLSGKCGPEKLRALPPAEQTRLAEALLRMAGERRAADMAVVLLGTAANANHPQARLALGRLYDPISFREGGPLRAANPERALDEYGRAAEAGLAEAKSARDALVARLKQEAAGADAAAADRAKAALRAAGIE